MLSWSWKLPYSWMMFGWLRYAWILSSLMRRGSSFFSRIIFLGMIFRAERNPVSLYLYNSRNYLTITTRPNVPEPISFRIVKSSTLRQRLDLRRKGDWASS